MLTKVVVVCLFTLRYISTLSSSFTVKFIVYLSEGKGKTPKRREISPTLPIRGFTSVCWYWNKKVGGWGVGKSRAEVPWALFMNIATYFRNFENSNERRPHKFWTKALNSDLSDVSAFR